MRALILGLSVYFFGANVRLLNQLFEWKGDVMSGINVKSEIQQLKKVLLHRPGKELLNLTPDTLEELLFDDIPFLKVAQDEHDEFAQVLRDNGVEVVYLEDLMAETLKGNPDLKKQFLEQFIAEAGVSEKRLVEACYELLDAIECEKELVLKTMEGVNVDELDLDESNLLSALTQEESRLVINPMPNLYFTRDPFASIGNGVSINHMYSVTRNRETIYAEYIFKYHPDYKDVPQYYDRYADVHIEGGDILNIDDHVLAIGISQRTQAAAIDKIAEKIFDAESSSIDTILAFDIPNNRAMMHLDTVFTQIDVDKFTIHPGIMGTLTVFELKEVDGVVEVNKIEDTLENVLGKYLECEVKLIPCGAGNRIAAEREQWNDGSNTLCIAPGTVVVYDRNDVTNEVLRDHGITVLEISSAELSRGRGGPRCMSMPLVRG